MGLNTEVSVVVVLVMVVVVSHLPTARSRLILQTMAAVVVMVWVVSLEAVMVLMLACRQYRLSTLPKNTTG